MVDYYVDNNETIYACDASTIQVSAFTSDEMSFGLSDLAELPGQSTWFINHVRFHVRAFYDVGSAGSTGQSLVQFVAGVVPRDIVAGGVFETLKDYDTIKGWPLKRCYGYATALSDVEPFNNQISVTRSYTPRKALVLNREQNLMWSLKNITGKDLNGYMSIEVQAKRGN